MDITAKSDIPSLSIEEVSLITGLSSFVLRAWEKRYKVVSPKREGPRRAYTYADVEKLKSLKALVDAGMPIRVAATLTPEELSQHINVSETQISELLSFAVSNSLDEFYERLSELRARQSVEDFLLKTVCAFLSEMGFAVERGELNVAQEHAISAILREQVIRIRRVNLTIKLPTLAFCAPGGDYHEMGILIAARLAESKGFPVLYLGPSLPADSLNLMIESTKLDYVFIAAAPTKQNMEQLPEYLRQVTRSKKKTKIAMAGTLASHFAQVVTVYPKMQDFVDFLNSELLAI